MRLLKINLLAAALMLFSVSIASASSITLVPTTPTNPVNVGDTVSFDIVADITDINVLVFGVGVLFDPNVLTYEPGQSGASGTYILYSVGAGSVPTTWLKPQADPWQIWAGSKPAGLEQVNVNWIAQTFVDNVGSQATGTGILLGNISFTASGPGATDVALSFDVGGTIFNVGGDDVSAGVPVNSVPVVVPEPTTALLVGLGMVGLGVAGRRRA